MSNKKGLSFNDKIKLNLAKWYVSNYEAKYGVSEVPNEPIEPIAPTISTIKYMTKSHKYDQDESLSPKIFKEMEIFINSDISFKYLGNDRLFAYPHDKPDGENDNKW